MASAIILGLLIAVAVTALVASLYAAGIGQEIDDDRKRHRK